MKTILFRRKLKVIVDPSFGTTNIVVIGTILKELSVLGYTLSEKLIKIFRESSLGETSKGFNFMIKNLKEMLGANRVWAPMYPNFPQQVMDAPEAELYFNAFIHYLAITVGYKGDSLPQFEKLIREAHIPKDLKVIDSCTIMDQWEAFKNIFNSPQVYTPQDKEDIETIFKGTKEGVIGLIPQTFSKKENMVFVTDLCMKAGIPINFLKTATDVLRLASAMSDGDISLAENTKFRKFTRKERRMFLEALNSIKSPLEDMKRHLGKWIRLGEILHPGEYKNRYRTAATSFDAIRNHVKEIKTFNSEAEKRLTTQIHGVVVLASIICDHLSQRPGEFARRLNQVLSVLPETKHREVLESFIKVINKVPTQLLLELSSYFQNRTNIGDLRIFFPKGNVSKVQAIEDNRKIIPTETLRGFILEIKAELIKRFSKLEYLGKVYIDPVLKGYNIPFATRSASKTLNTISRGSRIDMKLDTNTIRFFIWWENLHDGKCSRRMRVDVDLSAVLYKEDWQYMDHISYTKLKGRGVQASHSGDITDAPKGACEFIDIDINSVIEAGGRYVIMNVLSFTGQAFDEIETCFGGWMQREKPQSGEVFEPSTVSQKVDLTGKTKLNLPCILDCLERKIIWVDLSINSNTSCGGNNIESNLEGISLIGKAMTELHKPTLHQLFSIHAKARGELVENPKEADVVFNLERGLLPEDL